MVEITAEEQGKFKRTKRTEDRPRDLWGNIKCTNIQIIKVPKDKKNEYKKVFEEIAV